MRIAMYGHKHIFTNDGGIEVVISELAKRMSKNNVVVVYDRYELDKKPGKIAPPNANIIIKHSPTLSMSAANAQMASFFSALACMFGKQDIVHVHAEGSCVFLPLLKLAKKKVIVTIHGIDWQRAKWSGFAKKYIHFGEKMAVKYSDEIIVLSEANKDYFKESYGRETVLINNGVDIHATDRDGLIRQYGISRGDYILYLGRFAPEKRLDLLYEAYSSLDLNEKLILAGPYADLDESAEWYRKAKNDKRVIFTGLVSGDLKTELISNAKVFVLPSDLEGMSMSLLEALGCGTTVLVSDIVENKQLLHHFGHTFQKGNIEDLKEKLKALSQKEYSVNKDQADYICREYGWDSVVEKTLKEYEKIVR